MPSLNLVTSLYKWEYAWVRQHPESMTDCKWLISWPAAAFLQDRDTSKARGYHLILRDRNPWVGEQFCHPQMIESGRTFKDPADASTPNCCSPHTFKPQFRLVCPPSPSLLSLLRLTILHIKSIISLWALVFRSVSM